MKHTQESDCLSEKSTGMKVPHLTVNQVEKTMTWQDALKLLRDLGEIENDKN